MPPKDELEKLRANGMNRDEIAVHYNVSLSRVKRWIKVYDIDRSNTPRQVHTRSRSRAQRRRAMGADDGMTLTEKAHVILGQRISEDFRGYLLDGRPVRTDVLLKAAGLVVPEVNR